MTEIRYVGRKPAFRDHLYGSGATWLPGEARTVSDEAAQKLLRHPEFARGTEASARGEAGPDETPEKPPRRRSGAAVRPPARHRSPENEVGE